MFSYYLHRERMGKRVTGRESNCESGHKVPPPSPAPFYWWRGRWWFLFLISMGFIITKNSINYK